MTFNEIDYDFLDRLSKEQGDCFYLLDTKLFEDNYNNMLSAFRKYYENTSIAYSYKTNYLPALCKKIDDLDGYAEIVSEMEWWVAKKIGVDTSRVYYNGPYKKPDVIKDFLLEGGHLNIDAEYEANIVKEVTVKHPTQLFEIGLRCLVDIGQEESSRFGLDISDGTFDKVYDELSGLSNVKIVGLHLHLPFRNLETFIARMVALKDILGHITRLNELKYISLGGGYMGAVDAELAAEFSFAPPTYKDYAKIVAGGFSEVIRSLKLTNDIKLIIEPGSALVANAMRLVTRVVNIKHSRDRYIATLTGSTYNMNPSVKGVRRTIDVYSDCKKYDRSKVYDRLDMAGYTCIEGDYLYRGYKGNLSELDFVIFRNVGSYSVVMKPPFILPDVAVVDISDGLIVKSVQETQDIFGGMI